MKVVLSWLREFAPFPDDVDGIVDALANLGLPVEDLQRTGGVAGVVTARVLSTEAHPDAAKVQTVPDRRAAIRAAVQLAGADDIVLVAGKGHEPYQEIAGERRPFDDLDVARRALGARAC